MHVHDTGIGLSEEDLPKVFSNFGKVRMTASKYHEGNGFGLLACKRLVE